MSIKAMRGEKLDGIDMVVNEHPLGRCYKHETATAELLRLAKLGEAAERGFPRMAKMMLCFGEYDSQECKRWPSCPMRDFCSGGTP